MTYSNDQVMLSLSFLSYIGFYETSFGVQAAERTLRGLEFGLEESPCLKGEWEIVWGPAMYRLPLTLFDETMMFVVRSRTQRSRYTIVIRGTNPLSLTTWVLEDFNIMSQTQWPYGRDTGGLAPKMSLGTARGLQALQAIIPRQDIPGAGVSLYKFLVREVAAVGGAANISVTGHSLAGALAPTLALWLADTMKNSDDPDSPAWNPSGQSTLEVVSFAGPSPGNADFARYYDKLLGKTTRRIWNSFDVVPHGWMTKSLAKLPDLYAPHVSPHLLIRWLLLGTQWLAARGNYEHVLADSVALDGGKVVPLLGDYIAQMLYQHTAAYPELYALQNEIDTTRRFHFSGKLEQAVIGQRAAAASPEMRAIDKLDPRRSLSHRVSTWSKAIHRIYQIPATIAVLLVPERSVLQKLKQRASQFHGSGGGRGGAPFGRRVPAASN